MKSKASCSVYVAIVRVAAVPVFLEQRDSIQCQMVLLLCKRRRKENTAQRRIGRRDVVICLQFSLTIANSDGVVVVVVGVFFGPTPRVLIMNLYQRERLAAAFHSPHVIQCGICGDLFIHRGTQARSQSDRRSPNAHALDSRVRNPIFACMRVAQLAARLAPLISRYRKRNQTKKNAFSVWCDKWRWRSKFSLVWRAAKTLEIAVK